LNLGRTPGTVSRATFVSAKHKTAQPALERLNDALISFYNSEVDTEYFECAEAANRDWNSLPYHRIIRQQARPGLRVLDLGCGSAHALQNLQGRGVSYIGVDWSARQVEINRDGSRGLDAEFRTASLYDTGLPDASFDLVFSTYVIEHLVWPHRFLAEAMRLARHDGTVIILGPHFRPFGHMPSLFYGLPVAPLREKLRKGALVSAARHAWTKYVTYPRLLRAEFPPGSFPFLINLAPTCLLGRYYADNDAVYWVSADEVLDELVSLGGTDVTPELLWSSELDRRPDPRTCFVAVRKDPGRP
jgi:SAM-dependent methyltransferase